jgi:hypothetical protein
MISTFVTLYRMAYHDPAVDMSFVNSGISTSLAYSSLGGGKPVNMSLSASYDRFSQSFGSSSYINTSLTAGSSFLKSRALSLSGTAGYCLIRNDGSDSRNDILLSVNLGYQVNSSTFSFFVNYNMTPRDRVFLMNEYILKKQTTYKLIAGISYSSSF